MSNWLGRIFGGSRALANPTRGWERIEFSVNFFPLVEFSIPDGDHLWALSRRGLHSVALAPEVTVRTVDPSSLDSSVYDEDRGVLLLDGQELPLLGRHGGSPITRLDSGEQLEYGRCDCGFPYLSVQDAASRIVLEVTSYDSAEFAYATFSRGGRYIAFGCTLFLIVFRRAAGQVRRRSLRVECDNTGGYWVTERSPQGTWLPTSRQA
jgi:hypothetical protein